MKSGKSPYPRYEITLMINDKVVRRLVTRKKGRIMPLAKAKKWDTANLRFQYDSEFHNEGEYSTLKDFHHAFVCFLEVGKEFE